MTLSSDHVFINATKASAVPVRSATPSGDLGYCRCYLVSNKGPVTEAASLEAAVSKNRNAGGHKPTTVIWKMRNGGKKH